MKSAIRQSAVCLSTLWLTCFSLQARALGDLMLFPTRVVFENNQRTADVGLINNSDKPVTYRIKLDHRRMDEKGNLVVVTDTLPGERFADDLVRFSPRQVTLPPNGSQTVKIVVRKPADLADGEYRSHLLFERQPDAEDTSLAAQQATPDTSSIQIKIVALVGAAIPVIVRQGATRATVRIDGVHLAEEKGYQKLVFTLHRTGNQSVYGDVTGVLTATGDATPAARIAGIALYTPNAERQVEIPLAKPIHGHLHLTYKEKPDSGGKVIAEADADL